jgi:hypothetical protein
MAEARTDSTKATPEMYARVFEGHAEGRIILEDLVRRFYDKRSFTPGGVEGARMTDFKEGMRASIAFILKQLGQVREGDPNDDSVS